MKRATNLVQGWLFGAVLTLVAHFSVLSSHALAQPQVPDQEQPRAVPQQDDSDREAADRREQRGERREERREDRAQRREEVDGDTQVEDNGDGPMRSWLRERLAQVRAELAERIEDLEEEINRREDSGDDTEDLQRELEGAQRRLRDREGLVASLRETWREEQRERLEVQIRELEQAAEEAARAGRSEQAAELNREAARLRAGMTRPRPGRTVRMNALRNAIASLREAGLDDVAEEAAAQLQQWVEEGPAEDDETSDVSTADSAENGAYTADLQQRQASLETSVRDLRTEVQQLRREFEQLRRELRNPKQQPSDDGEPQ